MSETSRGILGRLTVGAAVVAVLAAAPAGAQQQKQAPARALGVDTTNFDRSARPQDDFYEFVNGGWMQRSEIPPDRSSWGSFVELSERSQEAVRGIIEAAASSHAAKGTDEQKIGDFYESFMDTARIDAAGLGPLEAELKRIAGLSSESQLPSVLAHLARIGVGGPFGAFVGQDQKNSNAYIVSVSQGGLGLPDRDYYLRQDAKFESIRSAYTAYLGKLFTLAGQPDPAGAARRIVALETRLAEKQWPRAKMRDRDATYNKRTVAELDGLTPSFSWAGYLKAAGLSKSADVIVRQPDYFQALDGILKATPVSTWREYLTARLLSDYAAYLPAAYETARFDFYGKVLSGQQEQGPRWKRGVSTVQRALGEAVGREYVAKYFKPSAKARMDQLVKNMLAAYRQSIDELDWMSPATKKAAQAKLAKFTVKIGYPDHWRDYSKLVVEPLDLIGNEMRSREFGYDDMAGRLGKPVDRSRWGMTPQTVNAYYNATNNEIVFPAAILQPPFFNPEADDAVNYGGIGAVIGHEISHGFDDQGSKSDGNGNLRDWWTPADLSAFKARTTALADEYSAYVPIDDIHINGRLTLGENIGDLSGLTVALRAYHMSLGGRPAPVIDGYTGDQRFFLGWAQVWRTKMRPEALRQQLLTNPHSPGQYRAFVPLTNMPAFYKAFGVQPGDKMWRDPKDRVTIW